MNTHSRKTRAAASASGIRSNPAPPPAAEGAPSAPPPLDFGDPADVQRWLESTRASLLDLLAVAREGARRPRKRVLSRAEMRRQARDAFAQVSALLDLAVKAWQKPG